ncbi:unnamed protein product [Adineta steineri]|uniref:Uncharacterized protein n=1 Tax=Adineta steineri TaxID=433720 RepID=A0A815HD14_9BILA|nr:unnamed protein product [Adineta steineri]CAF3568020.1 unnamed protein product [Adineta steineri]
MLKHLIIILSLIQVIHCLSTRSNIWWSRRNDNSERECNIDFENKNPSLEGKICGYCFVKCQQQFAACLLAQMNQVVGGALDFCENMSNKCEATCLSDKRTGRIAVANWPKVVTILQQFNPNLATNDEQKR